MVSSPLIRPYLGGGRYVRGRLGIISWVPVVFRYAFVRRLVHSPSLDKKSHEISEFPKNPMTGSLISQAVRVYIFPIYPIYL